MNFIKNAFQENIDTQAVIIERGALYKVPQLYKKLFGDKKGIIVTDIRNFTIAAKQVENYMLKANIDIEPTYIFDSPKFYADWKFMTQLEDFLKDKDVIAIGIGSGVINDLIKLASEHLNRQYLIVGTAASMDGYTAFGASITKDGNKQNFDCKAPLGVVFDPEIAVKAREGQSASGYADLLAKVTAGADWIIADYVKEDKLNKKAFDVVQNNLNKYLSMPEEVNIGDIYATQLLAEGLLMSGFAMQICHSSRPASGLEHLFSHYWEMEDLRFNNKYVSHGFMVGIGTLVSTAILEFLINYDMKSISVDDINWPSLEKQIKIINKVFLGKPVHLNRALIEAKKKYKPKSEIKNELNLIIQGWDELKLKIKKQIYSYKNVYDRLKKVGAPYEPEQIGIDRQRLKMTLMGMPFMRDRYTNIDLVYRAGLMDKLINHLFGKDGIWEIK